MTCICGLCLLGLVLCRVVLFNAVVALVVLGGLGCMVIVWFWFGCYCCGSGDFFYSWWANGRCLRFKFGYCVFVSLGWVCSAVMVVLGVLYLYMGEFLALLVGFWTLCGFRLFSGG